MLAFWSRGDSVLAGKDAFRGLAGDSQTPPLQPVEDGRRMLSPETRKASDDELGNQPPPPNANEPSPLSEEE